MQNIGLKEEEEFSQPFTLKEGLQPESKKPTDLLPQGKGLKPPASEETTFEERREAGFRKEGGIPEGVLPSQRGGLKEESGFAKWVKQPAREAQARLEKLQQENWLRDSQIRMQTGMPSVAQATVSFESDDLPTAVTHLKKAYDQILDGGEIEGIVKPFDRETTNIANGAGVEKLIRIKQPDGNIVHLPLDKDNIQQLLNKAKGAFNPQTFITSTMTRNAAIKAHNEDQALNPTIHADDSLTRTQMDPKTGKKRSEWFKDRADYIDKTGIIPHTTPTAKDDIQDAEMKKKRFMTSPGGLVDIGRPREEPGIVPGTEPPIRTTGKGPTILDPSKMVKGRDEKGQEVNGWVINGKFLPMPNVSKARDKKGDIDEKTITKMYAEFSKAYDTKFIDDMGGYVEGRGPENREIEVEKSIRQALPRKYWRKGKLGPPRYSEKYKSWFAQDQLGEWWPVAAPKGAKAKTKGIKEPGIETPIGQKVTLPIRKPK